MSLPSWAKREGGHEDGRRSTRRRKDNNQDQVLELTARVEGPPTIQEASLRFDDSDNDTVDTATKKNMPFVKIVFRLRGEQETLDLTSALRLLKADIRHGSMPRSKATKELVKMLKDINKR